MSSRDVSKFIDRLMNRAAATSKSKGKADGDDTPSPRSAPQKKAQPRATSKEGRNAALAQQLKESLMALADEHVAAGRSRFTASRYGPPTGAAAAIVHHDAAPAPQLVGLAGPAMPKPRAAAVAAAEATVAAAMPKAKAAAPPKSPPPRREVAKPVKAPGQNAPKALPRKAPPRAAAAAASAAAATTAVATPKKAKQPRTRTPPRRGAKTAPASSNSHDDDDDASKASRKTPHKSTPKGRPRKEDPSPPAAPPAAPPPAPPPPPQPDAEQAYVFHPEEDDEEDDAMQEDAIDEDVVDDDEDDDDSKRGSTADDGADESGDENDSESPDEMSDSVDEARKRVSTRRRRKDKDAAMPDLGSVFKLDLRRSKQGKVTVPDVLSHREEFKPSLAQGILQLYNKSVFLSDSTAAAELFERDVRLQQESAEIPNAPFGDPRRFAVIQAMLKHHPGHQAPLPEGDVPNDIVLPKVPVVTRAYERAQMRTPRGQERQCVNGKNCVCMHRPGMGFIMKEFLLPEELERLETTGQLDITVQPCVICERDGMMYISVLAASCAHAPPPEYIVQRWCNMVDVPNEYSIKDSLLIGPGILYPFVANKSDGYTRHTDGDGFYLEQTGYKQPTDFR